LDFGFSILDLPRHGLKVETAVPVNAPKSKIQNPKSIRAAMRQGQWDAVA